MTAPRPEPVPESRAESARPEGLQLAHGQDEATTSPMESLQAKRELQDARRLKAYGVRARRSYQGEA